jgi:hypothetical protein
MEENRMEMLWSFLVGIGGGTLGAIGVIKWMGILVKDRLNLKWQQDYKIELENLKAAINRNQAIISSALNTFASGHNLAQEKRLNALDSMWRCILSIRNFVSPVSTFYSILLSDEYVPAIQKNKDIFLVSGITDETLNKFLKEIDYIEVHRPYLGENIWSLFYAYRAFMLRLTYLFIRGKEKNHIEPWHNDNHLIVLLKTSLDEEDLKKINLSQTNSILYGIQLFEQRILIEVNKFINGEYSSEASFKEAKRLMEIVNNKEVFKN